MTKNRPITMTFGTEGDEGHEPSTPSPNRCRAVIWDLGGVLVRTHDWSRRLTWDHRLGLPPYALTRIVFQGEVGRAASLGEAQAEDVWRWVGEEFRLDDAQQRQLRQDFWAGDRLDHELVTFIRGLRPSYKTGLISNAWSDLRPALEQEWHIADIFDDIVISAEVGMVKPDPRIFQLSLRNLDVAPEEAIFIDDFEENLKGARWVGLQALHFRTSAQIRVELRQHLRG